MASQCPPRGAGGPLASQGSGESPAGGLKLKIRATHGCEIVGHAGLGREQQETDFGDVEGAGTEVTPSARPAPGATCCHPAPEP